MSADRFLHEWARLTTELTSLIDTALDVEPPGSCPPAWSALLTKYSVAPLPEPDRLPDLKRHAQTKGAPLTEVQACLDALARHETKRLEPLWSTLSAEQAALVRRSLHDFAGQALTAYRAKATEKKKKMFGAAKALAHQHQYGGPGAVKGYVLSCSACRGPRLGDTLTCAFCGGPLEAVS